MLKYYLILITALLIEVGGTMLAKWSDGMRNIGLAVASYSLYAFSIYLFSVAIRKINLAVADTIWQGLGIVLVTIMSYFVFKEPISARQLFFIFVTLVGVIGLGV